MHKILIGLFVACLILPTQVYSKCAYNPPSRMCKKFDEGTPHDRGGCLYQCKEQWSDEEQKEIDQRYMIFNNCYVSMLSDGKADRDYKQAVKTKCARISENPGFWDKIKYGD